MKLSISQIVLERVEFKHPDNYFNMPPSSPVPQAGVTMYAQTVRSDSNPDHAAMVRLTVKSDDDALYKFVVTFAVFFGIEWEDGETVPDNLDKRLMATGSTMLMPFVREVIASLTARGRFGTVWLAPTNIAALVENPEPVAPKKE